MSKLFNPKVKEDTGYCIHAGELKAIGFQCSLDEFRRNSGRFKPRMIDTETKIAYKDKNSCL